MTLRHTREEPRYPYSVHRILLISDKTLMLRLERMRKWWIKQIQAELQYMWNIA